MTERAAPEYSLSGAERERSAWPGSGRTASDPLAQLVRSALATDPALAAANEPLEAPSDAELGEALRTVARHLKVRQRDEWERAVEGLGECATLDPDQLYQAQRYAALKRWVLEHVPVAEPSALAALIPERVGNDTNTARVIERLRTEQQLLAVPYKRGWRYPLAQIDRRGRVHTAIPDLIARAREQEYDAWEIVHFLARPGATYPPLVVGTAAEDEPFESLGELVEAAFERAPVPSPPSHAPSPFERLAAGDETGFEDAARRFPRFRGVLGTARGAVITTRVLVARSTWWCVQLARFPPTSFNPNLEPTNDSVGGRFNPFLGEEERPVPSKYLADHPNGAFAETLFRDGYPRDWLTRAEIGARRLVQIGLGRDLVLADLSDTDPTGPLGVALREGPSAYARLRHVAASLYRQRPPMDGLLWDGRQLDEPGMLCAMLFGDRVSEAHDLAVIELLELEGGEGLRRLRAAATARGFALPRVLAR